MRPAPAAVPSVLSPAQLESWDRNGYLILPAFFTTETTASYRAHVDALWRERHGRTDGVTIDGGGKRLYFCDTPDEIRRSTYKLNDLFLVDELTRRLDMDARLIAILHRLLGHEPIVCNSLLFEYGSEQEFHFDTFYMPPATPNQMLATWIALDDVTEDNGPLLYVPGSHKLPPPLFSHGKYANIPAELDDMVAAAKRRHEEAGLNAERFFAKDGDVLIWHAQLFHSGDRIRDYSKTRTSLVTHYFSARDDMRHTKIAKRRVGCKSESRRRLFNYNYCAIIIPKIAY